MASQTLTGSGSGARVNLLPSEIAEKEKSRRAKAAMLVTGVAAVGVVGALYVMQSSKVSAAKSDLSAAQSRTTQLNAELAELQNVQDIYAKRQAMEQVLATAMGREVRWSRFLNDLSLTIPANVWINSFKVNQVLEGAPAAGGAVGNAVLADEGLGTVNFAGNAMQHYDVAAWLESLQRQAGYINAFATKITAIDEQVEDAVLSWESSVDISSKALSNRYTKRSGG